MISTALTKLMKKLFLIFAASLLLGMPLILVANDNLSQIEVPSLETMDATGLGVLAGLVLYSLIMSGLFLFQFVPAVIEVIQVAWSGYRSRDGEKEMFP